MEERSTHNEYEEAEVVSENKTRRTFGDYARDETFAYARDSLHQARRKLIWTGIGTLVVVSLIVCLLVALIITLVIWLLPFALAALFIVLLIAGMAAVLRAIYSLFK